MGSAKILVVGAIEGQVRKAFEKISKLQAKQNFALALVLGDLFGTESSEDVDALLSGQIHVPLPTYFSVGDSPFPETVRVKLESETDLCPNLLYLGRKSTMTTTEGIRIVSLGGKQLQHEAKPNDKPAPTDPAYLISEARGLHGAHSAHILLTNEWPAQITNATQIQLPESVDPHVGTQSISALCEALKPWYHFSSSPPAVWEREPYKHVQGYDSLEEPSVTRFKSLPSISAPTKEWMTAFSLDTSRPPATLLPPTASPFVRTSPPKRRAALDDQQDYRRYADDGYEPRQRKRQRRDRNDPSDCFMCLNKPGSKTHLVVSLGDESMVTVSRGPLPLPTTFPQLSFTGHAMIIPYYHAADEVSQGTRTDEERTKEYDEMTKFRKALSAMVGSKSNSELGTVCWEVNRTGIRHFHWQLVPCPTDRIKQNLVEAAFKVKAEQYKYPTFQQCDPHTQLPERSDYFRVWTWSANPIGVADQVNGNCNSDRDTGVTKSIYFPLPTDQKFNIWFGREVLASLLQLEQRVNWMDALLRKDGSEQVAEEEEAQGLRGDFEDFDFAMG